MIPALIGAGASLLGGFLGNRSQQKMADQNIAMQKEFATKGIQWKVRDSLKAGVHPLFGLGAQTHSFAPVSIGDSLGPAIADAGQQIGRAVGAGMEPETQLASKLNALTVERGALENELLRSQIRQLNAPGTAQGMPSMTADNSSPLRMAGVSLNANPGWSDAADVQNRWGELGEWLYGVPVIGADVAHNLKVPPAEHAYQQGRFNRIMDAVVDRFFGK